jgi:hypothetical protein
MSAQIKIVKISRGRFIISWLDCKELEGITLDFNTIIKEYKLDGNFCLFHWQSKPINVRQFGVYDSFTDSYNSFDSNLFSFGNVLAIKMRWLQVPDSIARGIRPSAVLGVFDCVLNQKEDKYTLLAS